MADVTANANPSNIAAKTTGTVIPQEALQVELTNNAPIATATTTTTPYGFATADQGDDLIACVREMRAGLIALGLFKDNTTNAD